MARHLKMAPPALPQGFEDFPTPDVALNGYVYVNPTSPLLISGPPLGLEEDVQVKKAVLWATSVDSFAMWFAIPDSSRVRVLAQELAGRMEAHFTLEENDLILWKGEWARKIEAAFTGGQALPFQQRYKKDIWETLEILPEAPPVSPVAAGFIRMEKGLVEALGASLKADLGALGRLKDLVFSLYARPPIKILPLGRPMDLLFQLLHQTQACGVVLARGGFGLELGFNAWAERRGFRLAKVGKTNAFHWTQDGFHVLARTADGFILLIGASRREEAETLLQGIIEKFRVWKLRR